MTAVSAAAANHFIESIKLLRRFYLSLNSSQKRCIRIHFHPGAAALSAQVRDPQDSERAALVFTPKWSTDTEPENRLYCVLERRKHKPLFDKLYGAIPGMTQGSVDLKKMCAKLDIPWRANRGRK